jgi:integrase
MALWKRGRTYWTDFTLDAKRYRVPLGTRDEREAKRLEKVKITEAAQGKLATTKLEFSRLGFQDAAEKYIEEAALGQSPNSVRTNQERARSLKAYFQNTPLLKITPEAVRGYIKHRRTTPTPKRPQGVSNRTVNMERAFLLRVMKRAKLHHRFADEIKPLPERHDVGQALTAEEKIRLVETAAAKPEWVRARLAMTLALNTTMRTVEVRNLQWRDVDLMDWKVTVRRAGTKTDAGARIIPLNKDARRAVLELRDQAKALFGDPIGPEWYLFPRAEGFSRPDPTKPASRGGRPCEGNRRHAQPARLPLPRSAPPCHHGASGVS